MRVSIFLICALGLSFATNLFAQRPVPTATGFAIHCGDYKIVYSHFHAAYIFHHAAENGGTKFLVGRLKSNATGSLGEQVDGANFVRGRGATRPEHGGVGTGVFLYRKGGQLYGQFSLRTRRWIRTGLGVEYPRLNDAILKRGFVKRYGQHHKIHQSLGLGAVLACIQVHDEDDEWIH